MIQTKFLLENDVLCIEEGVDSSTIPRETNIFGSCIRMNFPGHCRLLLERYCKPIPYTVQNALCDDGCGRELLSSDLYLNAWLNVKLPECAVKQILVEHCTTI